MISSIAVALALVAVVIGVAMWVLKGGKNNILGVSGGVVKQEEKGNSIRDLQEELRGTVDDGGSMDLFLLKKEEDNI